MIVLDVIYIAVATIGIMMTLQVLTFLAVRVLYPPEPKVIYRDVPVQPQPVSQVAQFLAPPPPAPSSPPPPPVFTQPEKIEQVDLPEYDIRKSASGSLRLDAGLPDGLQETRPPGT
jgi:hypothetical protein